ncbi:hypothetical protein [Melittangium boletus]|uniref:hypothetical protein n=1 Tax=Melittangium boletus TaxID=83453 RepID=UPI003DA2E052
MRRGLGVGLLGLGLGCAPGLQSQSCVLSPGCLAPAAGGEVWLTPAPAVVRAAQAVRGLLTLKDFLDEVEVARVEAVLVACAREADFQVNAREYGPGKAPDDRECMRKVGQDGRGVAQTRAMELGTMKHAVAFACVERELGREFSAHLSREPRYGPEASSGAYVLTEDALYSLVPDIVLHLFRDATRIQFLYDFLFPCTARSKSDPLGEARQVLSKKLDKYGPLTPRQRRALVTPQLGISR